MIVNPYFKFQVVRIPYATKTVTTGGENKDTIVSI